MECTSCGAEITEILARHVYTISHSEKQAGWMKDDGDVTYSCGACLEEIDSCDIEDILRQVDEL